MRDPSAELDPIAPLRAALARRYEIERELGQGAFATVYLARDLRHDRCVAIKVLRVDTSSAMPEMRFLREIKLLARLQHPNILPLYDSGHLLDLLYYVMPYVEGESLRDRLSRERRMELRSALRIGREVADALGYAHRRGVIHRDIKPENILLSGPHAIVADFGIARVMDGAGVRPLTRTGAGSPGTPAYMSPEQMLGEDALDGRSDIYSLGCTLYEMLGGEAPFAGPSGFARRFTEDPPSVSRLRRDVPASVDEALRRAMARVPEDRFATAEQLADVLVLERAVHHAEPARSMAVAADEPATPLRTPAPAQSALGSASVPPAGADGETSHPVDAGAGGRPSRWRLARRPWIRWRHTALVLLAMLLLSGTVWVVRSEHMKDPIPRRVIVTPLANHTGSEEFDPVGFMLVDWVTAGLQRLPTLEVVPSPTAVQAFRLVTRPKADGARDPVREIAAEMGANLVVTGSLYRRADRLLLRVQVTDVDAGRVVQDLDEIDAPLSDPLIAVQAARSRLMGYFAGQDDERVRTELASAGSPPTYAAYVAFSQGIDRYLAADFDGAVPYFLEAHATDSAFVWPLLYASLCLSNRGHFARSDSLLTAIDRARGSLSEYQRAWLDYRKAFLAGRPDEALRAIRLAARLAPDSKASYNHAVAAFQYGYPREALDVLRGIPPERGPMRGFLAYWDLLGAVHHTLGEYELERAVGDSARRLYPDRLVASMPHVRVYAAAGRLDSLEAVLAGVASFPRDPIGPDYGELLVEAAEELRAHGHRDASMRMLERAYSWYRSASASASGAGDAAWPLARIAYALGWYEEVDSLVTRLRAREGDRPEYLGLSALARARAGRRQVAMAMADTLAGVHRSYRRAVVPLYRARIAAVLDEREEAVRRLREAFANAATYELWLHRDADLQSLRGYAPFAQLIDVAR